MDKEFKKLEKWVKSHGYTVRFSSMVEVNYTDKEITLCGQKNKDKMIYSLLHECGHIIMQHFANHASKRGKDAETEADLIGAFLAKKIGYSKANVFQFLFGVKADMLKNRSGDDHPEASDRVKFLKQKAGFELSAVKYIDSMVQQFQSGLAEGSIKQGVQEATGFIPVDSKLAHDPRYVSGLTVDIKPGETQRQAKKLGWKIDKNGSPPLLMKLQNQLHKIKKDSK